MALETPIQASNKRKAGADENPRVLEVSKLKNRFKNSVLWKLLTMGY